MAKSTLQAIAAVIADRYELKSSDATAFVAAFFDQIREGLAQDKQVKVRGLGTFKLQPVKARESVNVNTGERLVINGHDKMAFTPDNAMKELVNRPFADFETVMIKDGVNIDAIPTPAESATDEDGDECTTETTPTETESESSAGNHQPATEERPPVVDEGHTNRDEPQPVVKEVLPTEEETLLAEEDHQPSADKNPRATEEDLPHDEEIKARSDEEKSSSDKEQNEGKDEQPTVVNDQQVIETQTKEESPSEATVPTPPQRVVPRPRKPTPMERFSQLMGNVVLPIVALLSVIAIATGAYYYGKSQQEIPQRPTTPEVEKPQSSAPQPAKANDSAQAKVENSTKTENKTEVQTDQAQKKEVVAESKETKQVTPEGIDLSAANNYRKLRYGAYRIIGVEKKVVLRPGETMAKVCRHTLGKDMIGYFEAINGQKRRSPGDTILVPKVELRPEYRK